MPRIRWAKNLLAKINAQVSKSITFLKNACDMYPCCLWSLGALTILPKPRVTQNTWNIKLNSKSRESWSSQYFGLDSQCYILLTWYSTALSPQETNVYKQIYCLLINWQELTLSRERNWPKFSDVNEQFKRCTRITIEASFANLYPHGTFFFQHPGPLG